MQLKEGENCNTSSAAGLEDAVSQKAMLQASAHLNEGRGGQLVHAVRHLSRAGNAADERRDEGVCRRKSCMHLKRK
jgi:hypothetical protein